MQLFLFILSKNLEFWEGMSEANILNRKLRTYHPLTIRHLWEAENPARKALCLCSFDETYIVHERILFFLFHFTLIWWWRHYQTEVRFHYSRDLWNSQQGSTSLKQCLHLTYWCIEEDEISMINIFDFLRRLLSDHGVLHGFIYFICDFWNKL